MKKKIMIFFLALISCVNIHAENEVTIIAVGEAEEDKTSLSFEFSYDQKLKEAELKELKNVAQIIKDDFAFYKHKFEIKSEKPQYTSKIGFEVQDNKVKSHLLVINQIKGETVLDLKNDVWMNNIRGFSHDMANKAFQAITGKNSIFKTKIVFVSDRNSSKRKLVKELYIMDFDGERKQRLTFKKSLVIAPSISPDNQKILFSAIEARWIKSKSPRQSVQKVQNLNLYVYDIASRKTELISDNKGINSGAIFNKSGDSIYLTLSNQKNADIYKMNLSDKSLTQITTHFSTDVDPHINHNESLLTFLSSRHGKANIYTKEMLTPSKKVTRVSYVGQFNAAPRFNPEGDEIVFSSWVDNRFDIYRIGSDGRNLVRLTKNFGSNEEPWFSPDGEFIIFTSQKVISSKNAVQNIHIMTRDGELVKQLTNGFGKVYTPRWSN